MSGHGCHSLFDGLEIEALGVIAVAAAPATGEQADRRTGDAAGTLRAPASISLAAASRRRTAAS